MEMTGIKGVAYEVLMRSGLANGRPASRYDRGIGDGERVLAKGALSHQPAGGGDQPMGMSMGKRVSYAPFLMVIEGGKA